MKLLFVDTVAMPFFMISLVPFFALYGSGYPVGPEVTFIGKVLAVSCILTFSFFIAIIIYGYCVYDSHSKQKNVGRKDET